MGMRNSIASVFGRALKNKHAGDDKLAIHELRLAGAPTLEVSSPAFANGEQIPTKYTKDGQGISPPIHIDNVPPRAKEVAIVCEDPDAPKTSPFVHWVAYRIPVSRHDLDEGTGNRTDLIQHARNTLFKEEYTPPSPPPGHGAHHYHFQVFALDHPLDVPKHATRDDIVLKMRGHVLAFGDLVGVYERRA